MIKFFPITFKQKVSIASQNANLNRRREKIWEISHWSEENEQFILKFVNLLLNVDDTVTINFKNTVNNTNTVEFRGSNAESCLILSNLASLISQSFTYLVTNDVTTRSTLLHRISKIIHIMNLLRNTYLPKISNNNSDLTIQYATFIHSLYSAHYYEILALDPTSKDKPQNYLSASSLFQSAIRLNPYQKFSFNLYEKQYMNQINGIIEFSNQERAEYNIGSAIYYLRMAHSIFNSCDKTFQKNNSIFGTNLASNLSSLENENMRLYHETVSARNPLPTINEFDQIIYQELALPKFEVINADTINKTCEEIQATIKTIQNVSDSINVLLSLVFECDGARKQKNAIIYSDVSLATQTPKIDIIETDINQMFYWINSSKTTVPHVFDLEATCRKLSSMKQQLEEDIIQHVNEIDHDVALNKVKNVNSELKFYQIPQVFTDELAQQIEKCLEIMEQLNNIMV